MTNRISIVGLAFSLIFGGGCISYSRRPPPPRTQVEIEQTASALDLSNGIMFGFDKPATFLGWEPGTSLLYGVRMETDSRPTTRYVLIQVMSQEIRDKTLVRINHDESRAKEPPEGWSVYAIRDPSHIMGQFEHKNWREFASAELEDGSQLSLKLESAGVICRISLYDENAEYMNSHYMSLPAAFLRAGLFESCRVDAHLPRAWLRPTVENAQAIASLGSFLSIIARTPELRELVMPMVPKLPFLVAVLSGNLRVAVTPLRDEISLDRRRMPATPIAPEAYMYPITASLNGTPLVHIVFTVAPPDDLLAIGAGIIGAEATRSDSPSDRLFVYLLAARREHRSADEPFEPKPPPKSPAALKKTQSAGLVGPWMSP